MTYQLCSYGGRSNTSILSNLVVLDAVDLPDDILRIIEGRFAAPGLPVLLHEFTHHACLAHPVGLALSLLHILSQRAAWEMNELRDQGSVNAFFAFVARYYAAVLALSPISEGTALFAELDIYPYLGKNGVISIPGGFASISASRFYYPAFDQDVLQMKLQMARGNALEKKANLFAFPFWSRNGGYLLGYALVRSTWKLAAAQDSFFEDPDTFLAYLQQVVFSDYSLVKMLLDVPLGHTDFEPEEVARAYSQRVVSRLQEYFGASGLKERREAAEAYKGRFAFNPDTRDVEPRDPDPTNYGIKGRFFDDSTALLFSSGEEARSAVALMDSWAQKLGQPLSSGDEKARRALPQLHVRTINRRKYFWFGTLPIHWQSDGKIVRVNTASGFLTCQPDTPLAAGRGQGTIELIYVYPRMFLTAVLVLPSENVILWASGALTDQDRASISDEVAKRPQFEAFDNEMVKLVEDSLKNLLPAEEWQRVLNTFLEAIDNVYGPAAIRGLVVKNQSEFLRDAAKTGLLAAVGNQAGALRVLATASFLCASGPPPEFLAEGLKRFGYSLAEVEKLNAAFRQRFGGDLITLGKEHMHTFF